MKSVRFFSLFITLVLALSSLATPAVAKPAAEPANLAAVDKIQADLLDAFAAEGSANFFVVMAEKADLSAANGIADWSARGHYVYDTLREVAARSQAPVIAYAQEHDLAYRSFLTVNSVYFQSGTLQIAEDLAALPGVDYLRLEGEAYIQPGDEIDASPDAPGWNLDLLNPGEDLYGMQAAQVWNLYGVRGDGVVVANIDTGAYYEHEALVGQYRGNEGDGTFDHDFDWYMPTYGCDDSNGPCDNDGHGSGTVGIMAGQTPDFAEQIGVAPAAEWIACKGCEENSCSDAALTGCADWMLAPCPFQVDPGDPACDPDMRPHIVNNSWGGGGCSTWYRSYVQAWVASGIFPAFSAGNTVGCGTLGSPGDNPESFGTAAHSSAGLNLYAGGPSCFFPNPSCDPDAHEVDPHLNAPTFGRTAGNTQGEYYNLSGTSGASPHTAGAVALIWSANPAYIGDILGTFTILEQSTNHDVPLGNCGKPACAGDNNWPNYEYGWGYLDALAAVEMAGAPEVDQGLLDGYVYDADTGDPIAGATVNAVPGLLAANPNATTDPTGYYTITLVVGTYDVTASALGYVDMSVTGIEILTDTVTSQDFALELEPGWRLGPDLYDCFDLTRFDAEFFPADGMVYLLGGRSGNDTIGNIYQFDPTTGACSDTGTDMPTPISNYTANLVNDGTNDLLCTFGGRNSAGGQTLDVQCYDPIANTASVVATLPTAWTNYGPGAQAVVDNQVYIFGGFSSTTLPYMIARTDRYDPVTNTFEQLGDLSLARSYIFATVVDDTIYAFGGDTFDGTYLIAQTVAEKMDPADGTWDDAGVADLPTASSQGQAFGFDSDANFDIAGKIVLAGGGQWPDASAEGLVYDVAADTYNYDFPDLIQARRNHAGAFVPLCGDVDGLPGMWVFGGYLTGDAPPYAMAEYYPLACLAEPIASFDAEVGCALDVQFTDTSTGLPDEWWWDFGDGNTSINQNPWHTYDLAGDYVVTLVVTNSLGSDSITATITVNELLVAQFSWSPAGIYTDTEVQFTDQSTGGVVPFTYLWDFGDGSTSTDQNPTNVFDMPGDYTVSLEVTDANMCADTIEQILTVREPDEFFMIYLPVVLRNF